MVDCVLCRVGGVPETGYLAEREAGAGRVFTTAYVRRSRAVSANSPQQSATFALSMTLAVRDTGSGCTI